MRNWLNKPNSLNAGMATCADEKSERVLIFCLTPITIRLVISSQNVRFEYAKECK